MNPLPRFSLGTALLLAAILACAGGARSWYLFACTDNGQRDAALHVQGDVPRDSLPDLQAFRSAAPLAEEAEQTAHLAPGYPLFVGSIAYWHGEAPELILRWLQCILGTLTAGCYFLFARRSFHSTFIATLAGLFCALHPFWIINTAESNDGVLVTFLVSVCLMLGARGHQTGGAFTGLAFGIALAAVALTRAALLPFAVVALLGFLWQCKQFPLGWFAAFLALVGFVNGLAPWTARNYQVFERPVPIATSTYLHLWIGNNPDSTGSTLAEKDLRNSLKQDRLKTILEETNQAKRYNLLATDVWHEIQDHPTDTLFRRLRAAGVFLLGDRWLQERRFAMAAEEKETTVAPPEWLTEHAELILHATMIGMFALALLGWRWSYAWRRYNSIGAVAVIFIPLPYLLSHAEYLAGPRLPLDGVLLCYSAFALASLVPGLVQTPRSAAKANPEA